MVAPSQVSHYVERRFNHRYREKLLMKGIIDRLRDISQLPKEDVHDWLERAQDGSTFLQDICKGPEVLLYGRGRHALVHGVLVPTKTCVRQTRTTCSTQTL